jgi:hypothetical protein
LGQAKLARAFGLLAFAFKMFWPAKIFFGEKSLASKQIVAKISWGRGVTKFCLGTPCYKKRYGTPFHATWKDMTHCICI